jgi:hypothetical protein
MTTPSSQKASDRPIGFRLENGVTGQIQFLRLNIRPTDLRRSEPALQTPIPTLGGAWLDDWGVGLSQIVIAGHTGWRGGVSLDGGAQFHLLRDTIWVGWHKQRADAVAQGQSPDKVRLIFVDTLDGITAVVAPGSFSLNRSRSQPLLFQYSLAMTVLSDNLDRAASDPLNINPDGSSSNPDALSQGVLAANNASSTLLGSVAKVTALLPAAHQAIGSLLGTGAGVIGAVTALSSGSVGFSQAAVLAGQICQGSSNLLNAYMATAGLGGLGGLPLAQAASAFRTAGCIFRNVLSVTGALTYTDLSVLDGSSSCSTTLGVGQLSPFLGANPFLTLSTAPSAPIAVTLDAQSALASALQIDPALSAPPVLNLVSTAAKLSKGIGT